MERKAKSAKAMLVVLDGFGIGKDSPFNAIGNSIRHGKMPFYRNLIQKYPHSELITHGEAVGLPAGVMGNSEVGHMTMGAGRAIFQDLVRINRAIQDGSLRNNPVLSKILKPQTPDTRIHLMGLLSDGGVHSHIDHLWALLDYCAEEDLRHVCVHPFLDGRDTPPQSGIGFIEKLLSHPLFDPHRPHPARIGTLMGRYFAMDRDLRWERTEQALAALEGRTPLTTETPLEALHTFYAGGKGDEFVEPMHFGPSATLRPGDAVFFFNYRADRARQLTRKIWGNSPAGKKLYEFAGMTLYSREIGNPAVMTPQNMNHIFPEVLELNKRSQFRIAETEKYAHVTFFFNGGREEPFQGEERLLIPSPKEVATYDLKPEMSALRVASEAARVIEAHAPSFVLMNFANADMVGHTGIYEAAVRAIEALDPCLEQVVSAGQKAGYHVLITADHGNAEEMQDDEGRPHTQHTLNPVPAIWVSPNSAVAPKSSRSALKDGTLADIMPTLCTWMGLPIPPEVTGTSLC